MKWEGIPSPCVQRTDGQNIEWLPQERDELADFSDLERRHWANYWPWCKDFLWFTV